MEILVKPEVKRDEIIDKFYAYENGGCCGGKTIRSG